MSEIEWTDETWNPVTGCDRVSPGCKHCYALELAPRLRAMGLEKYRRANDGRPPTSGPAFGVTLHPAVLDQPLRWRKPRRVFVNSMSDLFHDEVPDDFICSAFTVMRKASTHTFQILTKRPERMSLFMRRLAWRTPTTDEHRAGVGGYQAYLVDGVVDTMPRPYVLPNVWLGTSIEMRTYAYRADALRATPAAVRFISAEPLLGSLFDIVACPLCAGRGCWDCRDGVVRQDGLDLTGIDWLIVGGESGAKARRIDPDWVRDLRAAARDAHTAFFFKQWGGRTPKAGGRELDGRTWDEFPIGNSQAVAA